MAHWKDVIKELLVPEDKVASIIDTYMTLGEILEIRNKVKKGEYVSLEDVDKMITRSMFSLGHYPFWKAYGSIIRPLWLQAMEKEDPIKEFFIEAIPVALTVALPHKQEEYYNYKKVAKAKLES